MTHVECRITALLLQLLIQVDGKVSSVIQEIAQVGTSGVSTYAKLRVILSIHSLFISHLKLRCQCFFLIWKQFLRV